MLPGVLESQIPISKRVKSQFQTWWNTASGAYRLAQTASILYQRNPKSQFHTWFLTCKVTQVKPKKIPIWDCLKSPNPILIHWNPKIQDWSFRTYPRTLCLRLSNSCAPDFQHMMGMPVLSVMIIATLKKIGNTVPLLSMSNLKSNFYLLHVHHHALFLFQLQDVKWFGSVTFQTNPNHMVLRHLNVT